MGEKTIRLVELTTLTVRRELTGHEGAVRALAFSPDGRLLASGSADTTILIWDVVNFDEAAGPARALPEAELEKHWQVLLDDDAGKAFARRVDRTVATLSFVRSSAARRIASARQ